MSKEKFADDEDLPLVYGVDGERNIIPSVESIIMSGRSIWSYAGTPSYSAMEEAFRFKMEHIPKFRKVILKLHVTMCLERGDSISETLEHIEKKYGSKARQETEEYHRQTLEDRERKGGPNGAQATH